MSYPSWGRGGVLAVFDMWVDEQSPEQTSAAVKTGGRGGLGKGALQVWTVIRPHLMPPSAWNHVKHVNVFKSAGEEMQRGVEIHQSAVTNCWLWPLVSIKRLRALWFSTGGLSGPAVLSLSSSLSICLSVYAAILFFLLEVTSVFPQPWCSADANKPFDLLVFVTLVQRHILILPAQSSKCTIDMMLPQILMWCADVSPMVIWAVA